MKPKYLSLEAFGPFKEAVEINFDSLIDKGIFLVTGPTGSGKSSLFDAMYYALYGQLSNTEKNKTVEIIKSQHADYNSLCFVEFSFEINQSTYIVRREPTQQILGVRNKPIIKQAMALVMDKDRKVIFDKISQVNEFVQNLLGLTASQFKQIVLLPQGEFQQLLFSDSKEKEVLFREVFNTHEIEQFTLELKRRYDNLVQSSASKQLEINQIINSFKLVEQTSLNINDIPSIIKTVGELLDKQEQELFELSIAKKKLNDKKETIIKQIEWIAQHNTHTATLNDLNKKQPTINQKRQVFSYSQQIEKIIPSLKQVRSISGRLDKEKEKENNYKQSITTNSEKLQQLNKQLNCLNEQKDDIEHLSASLKELETKQSLIKQKQALLNKVESVVKNQEVHNNKLVSSLEKEQSDKLKLEAAQSHVQQEGMLLKKLHQTENEEQVLISQRNKVNEIVELNKQFNELKDSQTQQFKRYKEKEQAYQVAYQTLIDSRAGILAQTLKDESPCPVCGSLHHPSPAKVLDDHLSDEQVEKFREAMVAASLTLSQSNQKISELSLKLSQQESIDERLLEKQEQDIQSQLLEVNQQLKRIESFKGRLPVLTSNHQKSMETVSSINNQLSSLKGQYQQLLVELEPLSEIDVKQSESINNQINEAKLTIDKYHQSITDVNRALVEAKALLKETNALLEVSLESQHNYQSNLDELTQEIEHYKQQQGISEIDESKVLSARDKQHYEQDIKQFDIDLDRTNYQLSLLQQQKESMREWVDDPDKQIRELEEQLQPLEKQVLETSVAIEVNQHQLGALKSVYQEQEKILQAIRQYQELLDSAQGSKANDYLSFERYVLSAYFKEVLEYANARLAKMSSDRYRLVVSDSLQSKKKSSGLDLEVFDAYTSKQRSVKSLSGGEVFNASLSLALGLSDVIGQRSGARNIETLFIDEGFGSLDQQTLSLAVDTLMSLNTAGKIVGIISHVSELQDQIEAKIVVHKENQGSRVEVI